MFLQISLLVDDSNWAVVELTKFLHLNDLLVRRKKLFQTTNPSQYRLELVARNKSSELETLSKKLLGCKYVISVLGLRRHADMPESLEQLVKSDASSSQTSAPAKQAAPARSTQSSLSLKSECKQIMTRFFGEDVAAEVDTMSESDCVERCRAKVTGLIGAEAAAIFDTLG